MHQYIFSAQLPLHKLVKLRKVLRDIFRFHVEEGVDDVIDRIVVLHVIHAHCGGDNCIWYELPVWICYLLMNYMSSAEEMSPRKIDLPDYS